MASPFSSWQSATASPSSSWLSSAMASGASTCPSLSGELELLGLSALSHQCHHPGDLPLLS
jgi:hypothetical protein